MAKAIPGSLVTYQLTARLIFHLLRSMTSVCDRQDKAGMIITRGYTFWKL